jgi:hypothetical protein
LAAPAAAAIASVPDGFKRTEDAEKSGDNRTVVDLATRTIRMMPMQAEGEPRDETFTYVYLSLLKKRARANSALKKFAEADADYKAAGLGAMHNMTRFLRASNGRLAGDKGSGGGVIMASLESAKAVLLCKSGMDTGNEWIDSIQKARPADTAAGLSAGISLIGVREMCVTAYLIHGGNQSSKAGVDRTNRIQHLNDAVGSYTQAISLAPRNRTAFVERAKLYRELGRTDLAGADEQKARELPVRP